jgi:hypothetical protein
MAVGWSHEYELVGDTLYDKFTPLESIAHDYTFYPEISGLSEEPDIYGYHGAFAQDVVFSGNNFNQCVGVGNSVAQIWNGQEDSTYTGYTLYTESLSDLFTNRRMLDFAFASAGRAGWSAWNPVGSPSPAKTTVTIATADAHCASVTLAAFRLFVPDAVLGADYSGTLVFRETSTGGPNRTIEEPFSFHATATPFYYPTPDGKEIKPLLPKPFAFGTFTRELLRVDDLRMVNK